MSETNHTFDVTRENFEAVVLENSLRAPVLVDFWAAWCGPCKMLMPVLVKLAEEYRGQFILAKVNIDEQQELANHFGVRSVPTVKVIRNGGIVDEFLGAQPESQIRAIIERYIERESDRVLAAALGLMEQGESKQAQAVLEQGLNQEPGEPRMTVALAELLMEEDYQRAEELLRGLPADKRSEPGAAALLGRLAFVQTAKAAPSSETLEQRIAANPKDSEARYQLAACKVLAGEYEAAMDQLLELIRRDRSYGEDAGRLGLLKVFDILGGQGELVTRYRARMFNAMH